MAKLIRIGYWRGDRANAWPDVTAFVDMSWGAEDRERVIQHLRHAFLARAYMGFSTCRLCGARNGSLELTDGTYIWPEGLAHYVDAHGVRLPEDFVRHVGLVRAAHEDAEVDERWWREAKPDWQ